MKTFVLFSLFFLATGLNHHNHEAYEGRSSGPLRAVAVMTIGPATGSVTLSQEGADGKVTIEGVIQGLTPGPHGFHVHEKGDLSDGCKSAGGHYNPFGKQHGGPSDANRHVGDLGNIEAGPDGVAKILISDSQLRLNGLHSIIGRSIVVHSDSDDFGRGGFSDSLTTGHAGSRVGCGVIGTAA